MLRLQRVSSVVAVGVSGCLVALVLTYRLGVVPLGVVFAFFALGLVVGLVSVLVIGVSVIRTGVDRKSPFTLVALVVVGCVMVVPLITILSAVGAPAIHDITTDVLDPPKFVEAVQYNTPGRTDYGGNRVAVEQHYAYPDIAPIVLIDSPDEAFRLALEVVRKMGWEIMAANAGEQRIEATDTTFWFGFADDIVIRIRPEGTGSRIDVRSLSRVGVGDLGVNARRIRRFRAALEAK